MGQKNGQIGRFLFEGAVSEPSGSVLYDEHLRLGGEAHLAEFAGYLMPLWYSSISREHRAVREAAGVFDCTHMGVLEVIGTGAERFLDAVTTNDVKGLRVGSAQYSYILDAAGYVLDDVIVYRRGADKFMVVVNAANDAKIKAYLAAVVEGKAVIDAAREERRLEAAAGVRDMRDTSGGRDCRVDIAVQGPRAKDVLFAIIGDSGSRKVIENLKSFEFAEVGAGGADWIISRTGYTGAKVGFEIFVHSEAAAEVWRRLIEAGGPMGLELCGLGARDSLRIEAGLPLYGHELDGKFNISPIEAGYGWAVKLEKKFFVGKGAMRRIAKKYTMKVIRVEMPGEKGIRPIRGDDGVLDGAGVCIGWVLSCAKTGEKQIALCYVEKEKIKEGDRVGMYYLARSESQVQEGRKQKVETGEQLRADIEGKVVGRFKRF